MPNRLLKLLADNRASEVRRFEVVRNADTPDEAEVFIYDAIVENDLDAEWWGGVSPQAFVKQLRGLDVATLHVRINSPGGSVFAGRAIETALREHKARVVVHVDGLAASAASFIAMAGDEIVMAAGAMMMIHKGWTWAWGNADELKATAELLDKIDGTLVQTYVARSGQTGEQVAAWLAAETWFTAQEAVDAGLADSVAEPAKGAADPAARVAAGWNLAAYGKLPAALFAGVQTPAPAPASAPPATDDHRHRQQQRLRAALLASQIE